MSDAVTFRIPTLSSKTIGPACTVMAELVRETSGSEHLQITALSQSALITQSTHQKGPVTDAWVAQKHDTTEAPRSISILSLPKQIALPCALASLVIESSADQATSPRTVAKHLFDPAPTHQIRIWYLNGGVLFLPDDFAIEGRIRSGLIGSHDPRPIALLQLPDPDSHHRRVQNSKTRDVVATMLRALLGPREGRDINILCDDVCPE